MTIAQLAYCCVFNEDISHKINKYRWGKQIKEIRRLHSTKCSGRPLVNNDKSV